MNKNPNIDHLLTLADDPDESVWESVRDSILEIAGRDLNTLNEYWAGSTSHLVAQRLEDLIFVVQSEELKKDFSDWWNSDQASLKQGITLICRILSFDFNEADLERLINPLAKSIWIELNDQLTGFEKIRIINHLLFEKNKFSLLSNVDARSIHMYLPTLLKTGKGHILTALTLICLIARELQLPVYKTSVGDLPGLAYLDLTDLPYRNMSNPDLFQPLFFIILDPGLEIYGRNQFLEYVNHLYPMHKPDIRSVSDKELVLSLLRRLKLLYEDEKNLKRSSQISELLSLCKTAF